MTGVICRGEPGLDLAASKTRSVRRLLDIPVRVPALALAALVAFVVVPAAGATVAEETALAGKYAPVVRLVEQPEECGPGEPYIPTDVDMLFGEPTVAFRGPWNRTDLVKIGPQASDLVNRYEYHLDFPGDPLDAGCDYELWSRRLTDGDASRPSTPTSRPIRAIRASLRCSTGSSTRSTTSTTPTRATGR